MQCSSSIEPSENSRFSAGQPSTVFITGGRSRLSRALVIALAARNASLGFIVASAAPETTPALYPPELLERIGFVGYDVTPLSSESIQGIFHVGWHREAPTPGTAARDMMYTEEVARLAVACQVPSVIFASTQAVYSTALENIPDESVAPCPDNIYGLSKVGAERLMGTLVERVPGCTVVLARISRVIGPEPDVRWSNTVHRVIRDVATGKPVVLQGVIPAYDLIDVRDVISALVAMYEAQLGSGEHIINIGSGKRVSWLDVTSLTGEVQGRDISQQITVSPGSDTRRFGVDITKAKRVLNWQPQYDLEGTIRDLLAMVSQ